ncbi:MAG: carboxyl transferase domain-containing protein, partial [Ruminiclostridium sp.]
VSWKTVGFVATDKAASKLTAEDSVKIARFVSFCDAFSIPVVTILDSEGFAGGTAAELSGSVRDAAKLAQVYASATTQKLTVITDKAYGSAYCAIAPTSDMVFAFDSSIIAPAAPKTAVIFLKGDELNGSNEAQLISEYEENEASAFAAAYKGGVDRIIDASETREAILSAIDAFAEKRVSAPQRKHINFVY